MRLHIIFGTGISREGDILDTAVAKNLVEKAGSWYSYDGTQIGQGREAAKTYLKTHPDIEDSLYRKITAA